MAECHLAEIGDGMRHGGPSTRLRSNAGAGLRVNTLLTRLGMEPSV